MSKGEVGVDAIRTSIGVRALDAEAALAREAEGVLRLERRDTAEARLVSRVKGLPGNAAGPMTGGGLRDESSRRP